MRPRQSAGFTLIELLVTIGIIAILVAMVTFGISHITKVGRVNTTSVTLGNLKSMVAELQSGAGLKQPGYAYFGSPTPTLNTAANFDYWQHWDTTKLPSGKWPAMPGLESPGKDFPDKRFDSDAVVNTQQIMKLLDSLPANRSRISALPADNKLEAPPAGTNYRLLPNPQPNPPVAPNPPIIVDAWGNPIIFVPASGIMLNVTDPSGAAGIIPKEFRAADGRFFWASAGPDGYFTDLNNEQTFADDNIYSSDVRMAP